MCLTDYVVEEHQTLADGEHKMVDSLIFKPGCPEDPFDATDDFEYEKLEMYHWEPMSPFHWSEYSIAEVGMDNCYVVDMEVDGDMERMVNIRTLEEFLVSKDPRGLKTF